MVNLSSICRDRLIKYLEGRRYTVVAEDNPLAAHPATIVVSRSGIQTPFLEPKRAKDVAYLLINDIDSSGFARPMSAVLGIRLQQLSAPVMYQQSSPGVFNYLRHPDGRIHDYIRYRYGKDFIVNVERMTREVKEIKKAGKDKNPLKNSQIAMVKKSAGNQGKEQ